MNILILENEYRNYTRLKRILQSLSDKHVVEGPLTSITETVNYLKEHERPDLILADIRLSDGLSFDAFEQTPDTPPIIFTTAYDEYAIRAFKYNSIDYLLKPVIPEELEAAIDKIRSHKAATADTGFQQIIEMMKESNYQYRERFLLPYQDGFKIVWVKDISHIFTENAIVRLYLNDGTSEAVPQTMDELERQLNPKEFFRANRQYIIRADSIRHIGSFFNSKLTIHLFGYPQTQIVVSREKAPLLKEWIDR